MMTQFFAGPDQGTPSAALRLGFAAIAVIAACVTAALPPQRIGAASPPAPTAIDLVPGQIDTVYADPTNVMYQYGPSESERSNLQAENAFAANITVTYDAGFMANPAAQAAFQAAVDIWRSVIVSSVPIRVNANFAPLGAGILGSAGPSRTCFGGGVGVANTTYAVALYDKLKGSPVCANLTPAVTSEINANFSSTFTNWDFGTSGVPVSGKYNFMTVVMHELGHGLGFFGGMAVNNSTGSGTFGFVSGGTTIVDIYDRFAVTGASAPLIGFVNPSAALGAQLVSNNTYFNGSNAAASNGGANPKLETHNFTTQYGFATTNSFGWVQGSSYSHLDDVLYTATPNGLMTFALGSAEVYTDPGPIVRGVFADEGWTLSAPASKAVMISPAPGTTVAPGVTFTWSSGIGVTVLRTDCREQSWWPGFVRQRGRGLHDSIGDGTARRWSPAIRDTVVLHRAVVGIQPVPVHRECRDTAVDHVAAGKSDREARPDGDVYGGRERDSSELPVAGLH